MTNLLRKRGQKGFTLVELMVVLLIIGILVAIAIPIYNKTQDNAKITTCKDNLRTIDGAVAQYEAGKGTATPPASVSALVTEGFLKVVPTEPTGGTYSIDQNDGHAICSKGHTYP